MKPSNFSKLYPWSSVANKAEAEVIAGNIMVILKRTGDKFRSLKWDEYKKERLSDGNFSEAEKRYFDDVIYYCKSPDTARLFSPTWGRI